MCRKQQKRDVGLCVLTGCEKRCSEKCPDDLRAKYMTKGGKKSNVSLTECAFKHFLDKMGWHEGDDYEMQKEVAHCPFKARGVHKADFYLPKLDLYVEVKGEMTVYAINELHWLLKHSGKNFYVLQVTCEDWMGDFWQLKEELSSREKLTARNRIREVTEKQYREIASYLTKGQIPGNLNEEMCKRLAEYLKVRRKDISRWMKSSVATGGKCVC